MPCMCMCICMCVYICMCICMCICTCLCLYVFVYVYVYVYVCVHVYAPFRHDSTGRGARRETRAYKATEDVRAPPATTGSRAKLVQR